MAVVTIYTDASFCMRSSAGGYGYRAHTAARQARPAITLGGGCLAYPVSCNNTAELTAMCLALVQLTNSNYVQRKDKVIFMTDSFFCIKSFSKETRGFCTKEQLNLIEHMQAIVSRLELDLTFKFVKAHHTSKPKHVANNWCDREAKKHMRELRDRLQGGGK